MVTGYCEPDDVRTALQEQSLSGPTDDPIIIDDIVGVSAWLRKQSGRHWYDSSATSGGVIPTSARSTTNTRLDVPSSPHAQRDQLFRDDDGIRYPVTTDGPFVEIALPHGYVESITRLAVRQRDGSVEDWVAASDKQSGRDEDYYLQLQGEEGYGRSYLYIRAGSIGARYDWSGILTVDYDYGLDRQDTDWQDVRRGVALLTAAQVVVDDDVLTAIPDNGQLVGVDTQAERLADRAMTYLEPYL